MKQLLLIFLLAFVLQGCKREQSRPENVHNYYYLTAEQLGKTPYFNNPDFDTLTFVSNLQDTLVFAKTSIDSSFYETIYGDMGSGISTHSYYQQININYQTLKGNGSFGVKHVLYDPSRSGGDYINYSFNGLVFRCSHAHIGRKTFYTFKDSIEIKNRIYKDLIILYSTSDDSKTDEGYVNQNLGLFYVIDKANNQNFIILN